MPILSDIAYRFSVVADVLDQADQDAKASVTAATGAATQIEVIGQDVKDITERTYTVVIPHSMSWLSGYIVSHFVAPLQERVGRLESEVANLTRNVDILRAWRTNFVDPNVELWVGFRQFFDGWPQSILFMWHDWLENPSKFADWATAPLTGPLVAYLAAPEHKQTRDNLTQVIGQAWREDANRIWEDVLAWLVSDT
jgi:hypothetical protein